MLFPSIKSQLLNSVSVSKIGETYARDIFESLNDKLKEEDVRRNQKAKERFEQHR
jgi:peptide subunit release factor 1 (eRF1)